MQWVTLLLAVLTSEGVYLWPYICLCAPVLIPASMQDTRMSSRIVLRGDRRELVTAMKRQYRPRVVMAVASHGFTFSDAVG